MHLPATTAARFRGDEGGVSMQSAVQIIFVPVPCAGTTHWRVPPTPPQYPRPQRERWPVRQSIPVSTRETRNLIEAAKRAVAEQRARELLRQLER
jgi:hypothetical protein